MRVPTTPPPPPSLIPTTVVPVRKSTTNRLRITAPENATALSVARCPRRSHYGGNAAGPVRDTSIRSRIVCEHVRMCQHEKCASGVIEDNTVDYLSASRQVQF